MMLCQPSYHSVSCTGTIGYHLNVKLKFPVTFDLCGRQAFAGNWVLLSKI